MSSTSKVYVCHKCDKTFQSETTLKNHLSKTIPCDFSSFECEGCGKRIGSESTYRRHLKTCDWMKSKVNNVIANNNNISNSHNTNTNTNNNTLINDVKNNIVMLHPMGLTHQYMWKDDRLGEVISPIRGTVMDLIRQKKFELAYLTMFKQIHGNPEIPEHHNIYVKEKGKNEACVFNGKGFKTEDLSEMSDQMYRILKGEMRWTVNTSDAEDKEKDQLMWDIHAHWMNINSKTDDLMERIFFNNKLIVEDTFRKYKVYTNLDYIARVNKCNVEDIKWDNSTPLTLPN